MEEGGPFAGGQDEGVGLGAVAFLDVCFAVGGASVQNVEAAGLGLEGVLVDEVEEEELLFLPLVRKSDSPSVAVHSTEPMR
jgi:hypothetical protein